MVPVSTRCKYLLGTHSFYQLGSPRNYYIFQLHRVNSFDFPSTLLTFHLILKSGVRHSAVLLGTARYPEYYMHTALSFVRICRLLIEQTNEYNTRHVIQPHLERFLRY